jgi:hypothetical protein
MPPATAVKLSSSAPQPHGNEAQARLPTDPSYQRFDLALFERVLNEAWGEPARRFPYFGRVEAT